jgi:hypothetical protein
MLSTMAHAFIWWLFAEIAYGQNLTVSTPNGDSVWKAGESVAVAWKGNIAVVQSLRVSLMVGPGAGVPVRTISESVAVSQNQTAWTVDDFLSTRNDYFVALSDADAQEVVLGKSERFNLVSPKVLGSIENSSGALVRRTGSHLVALTLILFGLSAFW